MKKKKSEQTSSKAEACTSRWGYREGTPPRELEGLLFRGDPPVGFDVLRSQFSFVCALNKGEAISQNTFCVYGSGLERPG